MVITDNMKINNEFLQNQYGNQSSGNYYLPTDFANTTTTTTTAWPGVSTWWTGKEDTLDIPEGYKFDMELCKKVKSILDLV